MFLSKESLQTEIITAKSSEMNVMIPNGDEFVSHSIFFTFYFSFKNILVFSGWTTSSGTIQNRRQRH